MKREGNEYYTGQPLTATDREKNEPDIRDMYNVYKYGRP